MEFDKVTQKRIKDGNEELQFLVIGGDLSGIQSFIYNLGANKSGAKRLRAKLKYWAKSKIQDKTILKARSFGIRFSRILANGTSMYAFDGSGKLQRNSKKDISIFVNKKKYHSDLNASYNIGARYFLREILKPLPEKVRFDYEAKVPHLQDRTSHTLSSLIKLHEVISNAKTTLVSPIQDKETLYITA